MRNLRRCVALLATVGTFFVALGPVGAQVNVDWIGDVGDFSDALNWSEGFVPIAVLDEVGRINNGGTAIIDDEPDVTGGIVLGVGSGDSGRLEILEGGALAVQALGGMATGSLVVGQSGTGHLVVTRGGSLTADSLTVGGNTDSSIVLGETGTGAAMVTVNGAANLNRNLRIVGPNVDFSSAGLTLSGVLTSVVTGPEHSTLNVNGAANVGGTLHLEFAGHTPSFDDAWDLVDATSISGNFETITSSLDPGPGRRFTTVPVAGGANGSLLRLQMEQILALTVDRASGSVSISNFEGGASVDLDGYAIVSPSGSLDPGVWNSLQDQGVSDFEEANAHSGQVSELNPLSAAVFDGGTSFQLGSVFSPNPEAFGDPVEDLTFEYGLPDGTVAQGLVSYEGFGPSFNNLVLTVDPASGQGTLWNASPFDVQIDGYAILSPSGALLPGDGAWNSLQDQSVGAWEEANISANQVAELNPTGIATLGAGANFDLGTLFDTTGERDLTLQFFMSGEPAARQGVLLYEAAEVGAVPGDYNGNGRVEQADLDLVLLNWGQSFDTLPDDWMNERPTEGIIDQAELDGVLLNWGNAAGLGTTVAVPEPVTAIIGLLAAAALGGWRSCLNSRTLGEES